jgi:hypothetical protein
MPELVEQPPVTRSCDGQIESEKRDGNGEHAVTEAFEALFAHRVLIVDCSWRQR